MSSSLVSVLHHEERSIVAELRASKPFQRLEAIRRLLALYDAQPSVATGLDMPEAAGSGGEVIHFAAQAAQSIPAAPPSPGSTVSAAVQAAVQTAAAPAMALAAGAGPVAAAIPMPGPVAAPVPMAKVVEAEAVVVEAPRAPAAVAQSEPASVVSSVRAALLGIGKN